MKITVNYDCRYFKGDTPCIYHKKEGVMCEKCKYYSKVIFRIVIIKLAAIGDVLRTTFILKGLKEKYSSSSITWITEKESIPLFYGNKMVDRALEPSIAANFVLPVEEFDLVINLDTSPTSAQLCTMAKATEKLGYAYNPKGYVYPINKEAVQWFQMGLFDTLKKGNKKAYQEIISEICRLTTKDFLPIYNITDNEIEFRDKFAKAHGLNNSVVRIGLVPGTGKRWISKRWSPDKFSELIKIINSNIKKSNILLYGGPDDVEVCGQIIRDNTSSIIETGTGNSLREFASLIDLADIVVTGDSLALHLANALKKKVVVLFGPTSADEIYLYQGKKITPSIPCKCYYKGKCDYSSTCMDSIPASLVYDALKELL